MRARREACVATRMENLRGIISANKIEANKCFILTVRARHRVAVTASSQASIAGRAVNT